jgi:methionyl aminopeptidase
VIIIKSKKEIDLIRESCRIVAETLQLLKSKIAPGVTTLELDRMAEDYITSNDAVPAFKGYSQGSAPGFPGSVCTSVDEAVVHGIPSERILKEGEIVSLDVGVLKNNYYGDAALSVAVGDISDEKRNLMDVTEKSLFKGIEQAKSGNKIHDISASVQQYVENNCD